MGFNELQLAMDVARFAPRKRNRRATPILFHEPLQAPAWTPCQADRPGDAARAGDGDPFQVLPALEVIEPYKALMPEVRTVWWPDGRCRGATTGS